MSRPSRRTYGTATARPRCICGTIFTISLRRCSFDSDAMRRTSLDGQARPEIGVPDRLVDHLHHALVPPTETESARGSRNADRRHLVDRHALDRTPRTSPVRAGSLRSACAQSHQFVLMRRMDDLRAAYSSARSN